jgi:Flp pilus assembly protein TadG
VTHDGRARGDDGPAAADRNRAGRDDGQAAVELALALPLVFLVVLAVVQVLVIARDQLAVIHAAREGARAAAVAADPQTEAASAARAASGLDNDRLTVEAAESGDKVSVVVRYRAPTDVALVGALVGDVTVTGEATMRVEP